MSQPAPIKPLKVLLPADLQKRLQDSMKRRLGRFKLEPQFDLYPPRKSAPNDAPRSTSARKEDILGCGIWRKTAFEGHRLGSIESVCRLSRQLAESTAQHRGAAVGMRRVVCQRAVLALAGAGREEQGPR